LTSRKLKIVIVAALCGILPLMLLSTPGLATKPVPSVTFNNPTVHGIPVDHCFHWRQQCGKPTADLICKGQGLGPALHFERSKKTKTFVLGDKKICNGNCDAFTLIICAKSTPTMGEKHEQTRSGGIVARLEEMKPCRHVRGPTLHSDYYVCDVRYSITNTTDKAIRFTSGVSQNQHGYTWKNMKAGAPNKGGIGYRHALAPGKKMIMGNRCVIPHGYTTGSLLLSGSGNHYGDTNKHRFKWRLAIKCP
jgi:hypothetical protein